MEIMERNKVTSDLLHHKRLSQHRIPCLVVLNAGFSVNKTSLNLYW